jgi:hypothetical protein
MEKDKIRQAVARGWCYPVNEKKEMDADLTEAISDEVASLFEQFKTDLMAKIPSVPLPDEILVAGSGKTISKKEAEKVLNG